MRKVNCNSQRGQVGLVVLLIMAALITIGLGVASQSVLEINTARLETDSSQAFNAAEQGIELALQDPTYTGTSDISGYNVAVQVEEQTDSYQALIKEGHSAQLLMDNVTGLELSWPSRGCEANREVIVVTLINAAGDINRQAYGRECSLIDGFRDAICTGQNCRVTLASLSGWRLARIKAVYNQVNLTAAISGSNLPAQSYEITSTATRPNSGEARSVQVNKTPASVPSIFDYALFSGADLAQTN